MKNKRLWLSVTLTVLVVVCAMLILSRINETRSNAAPAAPTDLILPPDIQTTAQPDTKKYDDLPDVDISSWEYLIASQAHNISDYVPDVSKISGSQSTFDSRAVDALNALLKAARDAGWSPYIYCAYRPYLTQEQQYEDQVSENMRKGDTRDEAIARGKRALSEFVIEGVATTIPFHLAVLENEAFKAGKVYTDFIEAEMNGGTL